METAKDRRTGPKRIGELLVSANILKPEVLHEALQVAKLSQRPLGRVLMSLGALNEKELEAALELQMLLREGLISNEFGLRALNLAVKKELPLSESFRRLGWSPPPRPHVVANELADLLLAAEIVDKSQLEQALAQSVSNKTPLGRCLVLANAISSGILSSALTAQVLVREGKITKDQAIAGLKAASKKQEAIEKPLEAIATIPEDRGTIRIGDLLDSAGLVSEGDKVSAVEIGLHTHERIGQIFLKQGLISDEILNDTLKLQELVNKNWISADQATEILKDSHSKGIPIDELLADFKTSRHNTEQAYKSTGLLIKASILKPASVPTGHSLTLEEKGAVLDSLTDSGSLSAKLLEAAIQAQNLVDDEIISSDQATAVLLYCQRTGVDFHTALQSTPWEEGSSSAPLSQPPPPSSDPKETWMNNVWSKLKPPE
jgi:hypothetical protein